MKISVFPAGGSPRAPAGASATWGTGSWASYQRRTLSVHTPGQVWEPVLVIRAAPKCVVVTFQAYGYGGRMLGWPLERGCGHVSCFGQCHGHHSSLISGLKKKHRKNTVSQWGWVSMSISLCHHGRVGSHGALIKWGPQVPTRIQGSLPTHKARGLFVTAA